MTNLNAIRLQLNTEHILGSCLTIYRTYCITTVLQNQTCLPTPVGTEVSDEVSDEVSKEVSKEVSEEVSE